jgi:hypothetical protein
MLVNADRNIGRLILENLSQAFDAYGQTREVDGHRFTDSDLFTSVLGATLDINAFHTLSSGRLDLEREAKRVAVERDRTGHVRDIDHNIVDLAEHEVPPSRHVSRYGLAWLRCSRV